MWQPTAGFMTHVTWRLTAKNRDQLRNPALGNRVRAAFFIPTKRRSVGVTIDSVTSFHRMYWIEKTSQYTKAARYATAWLDARTERERERDKLQTRGRSRDQTRRFRSRRDSKPDRHTTAHRFVRRINLVRTLLMDIGRCRCAAGSATLADS